MPIFIFRKRYLFAILLAAMLAAATLFTGQPFTAVQQVFAEHNYQNTLVLDAGQDGS